jgi:hypothetical protein
MSEPSLSLGAGLATRAAFVTLATVASFAVLAVFAGGCSSMPRAQSAGGAPDAGAPDTSADEAPTPDDDGSVDGAALDGTLVDGPASAGLPDTTPIVGTPLATFDSDLQGFALNPFSEPGSNLANVTPPATLTWIATDGSPDPGCLKVTAPYSASGQWVDVETLVPTALDWSGKTLHVRIKLDPSSTFTGFARLYVKTGAGYAFYPLTYSAYPQNAGWQEFVLPLGAAGASPDDAAALDPTQIKAFGVDPETTSTSQGPVTFYVDSFSLE